MEEQFGIGYIRPIPDTCPRRCPGPIRAPLPLPQSPTKNAEPLESELHNILEEVRVITNKIRDEASRE
jgi:hypothetical protein